jgi:cellobiose epimerase
MLSFETEIRDELTAILQYWQQQMPDRVRGGFLGRIGSDDRPDTQADKGSVLNCRILWTFSAAHAFSEQYLETAHIAFDYIQRHFTDPEYGGLYWSADAAGKMKDGHKQVYGQAFGIYAMSEYYKATKNEAALHAAIELFNLIEKYSYDPVHGGYLDAFERNWNFLADKRLSAKDDNAQKTANTHLHLVEAYANLYEVWPSGLLKKRIAGLLKIFSDIMIDPETHHLHLFFDEAWKFQPGIISYGHDIEASWLLQQCAEKIQDEKWIRQMKRIAVATAYASLEGIGTDGGLWYEYDTATRQMVFEKHWWPQAEAMVGFLNAWEINGDQGFRDALVNNWNFIRTYILDRKNGEWFWGVQRDHQVMPGQDKAGFWKCPYHNSRSCMEIIRRSGTVPPVSLPNKAGTDF